MEEEVKSKMQDIIPTENEIEQKEGEGYLTDEEIAELQPTANELAEETEEEKIDTSNAIAATKEMLFARSEEPFNLFVELRDQVVIFKVRRMKEVDRVKFQRLAALQMKTFDQLTEEEYDDIVQQSYELMADLIVEPKMSVNDWKEVVDLPLLNHLSNKTAILAYEKDDHTIAADFIKK
jgi:hypothetical protein